MTTLQVAETFRTIQGEGPHAGTPAIFLRLAGCNLQCGAVGRDLNDVDPVTDDPTDGASWVCDTIPVWKDAEFSVTPATLVDEFGSNGWLSDLRRGDHLVLTGGEPTLPTHQQAFTEFVAQLNSLDPTISPTVEVETNGTVVPNDEFAANVNLFNVSLKLSNSGHNTDRRLKHDAINWHIDNHQSTTGLHRGSVFKFVVANNADIEEIESLADQFDIPNSMVTVMPAGQTRGQLRETYPKVAELAQDQNWRFTPRLHVEIWNQQTGV